MLINLLFLYFCFGFASWQNKVSSFSLLMIDKWKDFSVFVFVSQLDSWFRTKRIAKTFISFISFIYSIHSNYPSIESASQRTNQSTNQFISICFPIFKPKKKKQKPEWDWKWRKERMETNWWYHYIYHQKKAIFFEKKTVMSKQKKMRIKWHRTKVFLFEKKLFRIKWEKILEK